MDVTTLLIELVSGAVGGNVAGLLNKAKSLGPLLNTVLGAIGGVGAGQLVAPHLGGALSGTAGNAVISAVVGLLLPLIGGMLKKKPA